MKKRISRYWPLTAIVLLTAAAWAHAWRGAGEQMPLGAVQLTAELARAMSYGLVDVDSHAPALKSMPMGSAGEPAPQAI
jgi:hypothetical protein